MFYLLQNVSKTILEQIFGGKSRKHSHSFVLNYEPLLSPFGLMVYLDAK